MLNFQSSKIEPEEQDIIGVIVFFDLFDHPLTAWELKKYLATNILFSEWLKILDKLVAAGQRLVECEGFYCLAGREEIVRIRQKRHNYSERKMKIARRFTRIFKMFPAVQMVALANSLGQNNLRDGSDIDFFIISSPKRIWLTRLFCASLAKMANSRPTQNNKRDKICLSFYLATDQLNLKELALSGGDPYFFYWQRTLVLLYNKNKTAEKFFAANGFGLKDDGSGEKSATSVFSGLVNVLEVLAKKLQLIIMSPALKRAANNSVGVVIREGILKLYLKDNRQEYAENYGNRLREILS